MTAQCVTNRMWAAPGAVRAVPGDSIEVAFSTVCRRVRAVCKRAGAGPVLPVDREFFTTGVPGRLGQHGVRWPVPCPNSPRAAAALRKFAAGKAARVLPMRIPGGRGREAPHAMIIRKRKKSEGRGPEGKHIAFATNMPSVDPDEPCPRRWGIEIGYKLPRHTRMRTPGRSESVRIFCFVMSLMVHNAWTMLHPGRRAAGDSRRIPATSLKFLIMLGVCNVFGVQPRLRPPRNPLP